MKLFVYGTLMQGHGNHGCLLDAKLIGEDYIMGQFEMFSLGSFPGLVKTEKAGSLVKGEVYEIDERILKRTDALEGYPHFYNREIVTTVDDKEVMVYFLERNTDNYEKIESGDWAAFYKTMKKQYW